jgi:hypothetical protein
MHLKAPISSWYSHPRISSPSLPPRLASRSHRRLVPVAGIPSGGGGSLRTRTRTLDRPLIPGNGKQPYPPFFGRFLSFIHSATSQPVSANQIQILLFSRPSSYWAISLPHCTSDCFQLVLVLLLLRVDRNRYPSSSYIRFEPAHQHWELHSTLSRWIQTWDSVSVHFIYFSFRKQTNYIYKKGFWDHCLEGIIGNIRCHCSEWVLCFRLVWVGQDTMEQVIKWLPLSWVVILAVSKKERVIILVALISSWVKA